MRGFYLAEQDKTVMRNIGALQVKSTETSNSLTRSVSGQVPRIGDRIYPVYTPPEAARQIKLHVPQTRIIALSMFEEAGVAETVRQAGAERYLLKTAPLEELLSAIRGQVPS